MDDDFGELMRSELQRGGYTLRAACKAMHRDPAYVSRVMNGARPSRALAEDLDRLLGTAKFTEALARQAAPAPNGDAIAALELARLAGTYDNALIAGQRRVEAFKLLGREEIPSIAVSDLSTAVKYLTAERDENDERKEMTVSEKVALAQALEEIERPKAEERLRAARSRGGKIARGTYKPDGPSDCSSEQSDGNTRDVVARAVGMSPTIYFRAGSVVASATDSDAPPRVREAAQSALAAMDETGNVSGAYDQVKAALAQAMRIERSRETLRVMALAATGALHVDVQD